MFITFISVLWNSICNFIDVFISGPLSFTFFDLGKQIPATDFRKQSQQFHSFLCSSLIRLMCVCVCFILWESDYSGLNFSPILNTGIPRFCDSLYSRRTLSNAKINPVLIVIDNINKAKGHMEAYAWCVLFRRDICLLSNCMQFFINKSDINYKAGRSQDFGLCCWRCASNFFVIRTAIFSRSLISVHGCTL